MKYFAQTYQTVISVAGYVSLVIGAVLVLMSKVKTDNLNDLKQRVEILENERKLTEEDREKERKAFRKELEVERESSRKQHLENKEAIANLTGQLTTYKEIPLKSIATSLEALPQIMNSNSLILETLKGSALIAATDRDALVNPSQSIENQTVEHQIVKGK